MTKEEVLEEIKRTTKENGAKPLGWKRFQDETGIRYTDWFGRFWARWGDALKEAGFSPNQLQGPYGEDVLIEKLIEVIRELGRFPVRGELKLRATRDRSFPNEKTFQRLGAKQALVAKVKAYCLQRDGYGDVLSVCELSAHAIAAKKTTERATEEIVGFVYLLKSGRWHKIGKSNAVGRRERELAIQLPERADTVHVIRTDDPQGIEAYWHKRFETKRKNGEWFELTAADVQAFKRRKFQ